jgi:hypothetical protein
VSDRMSDEAIKQVLSRLDTLAGKMSGAATQVWAIMEGQVRIEIIKHVAVWCLLTTVVLTYLFSFRKLWKLNEEAGTFEDSYAVALVAGGLFACIAFIKVLIVSDELLTLLLNPRYWILQQLMHH